MSRHELEPDCRNSLPDSAVVLSIHPGRFRFSSGIEPGGNRCLHPRHVHQAVFLADTTRPAACQHISKRLRLSQPLEWILHHCLDQIQHSDCGVSFGFDPKTEVLPELRLKDSDSLRISLHLASLDAVPPPFQACPPRFARRNADWRRRALRGDRNRCAVSMRPASSEAGRRATSRAPRRRTITVSCWSTT